MKQHLRFTAALLFAFGLQLASAFAQGTTFTYQGRLNNGGSPANGTNYGMVFYLYDAPAGGNLLGNQGVASVTVSNGLFTVPLNFDKAFDGDARWLEISVQTNGGSFTTLSPRQQITPTPYAIFANAASNVSGTVSGSQISGAIPLSGLPSGVVTNGASGVTISGTFIGNGAGVTNVNFLNINSGGVIGIVTNQGNFVFASAPGTGPAPVSVTTADVNNDGKADLISVNFSDITLSVLTNAGAGRFVLAPSPLSGNNPWSVTTADLNGDGKPDLIDSTLNGSVIVSTNNGSGGFPFPVSVSLGGNLRSVIAADVNFDGKLDVIVANTSSNAVNILTNNGSGGLVIASTNAVGLAPWSVAAADVNGDGKVDLISANANANTLTILTNNGSGRFTIASSPTVGLGPLSVIATNLNGDNLIDLVCANIFAGTLTVLTNNGSGGFAIASSPSIGSQSYSVTAADVNGDGNMDLICANYDTASLTVLVNDGNGNFSISSLPVTGPGPYSVTAGDFNNDGKVDLACANSGSSSLTVLTNYSSVTVAFTGTLKGDGGGLTGLSANNIVGGLSTNLSVTTPSGTKNLIFINGVLRAVQ